MRFAAAVMLAVTVFFGASYSRELPHISEFADANVEIRVSVSELGISDENSEEWYYAILDDGRMLKADPFEADGMTVFHVANDCFSACIDREKNKVLNELIKVEIKDDTGNVLTNDPIIEGIFREIGKLEHELFDIKIMKVKEAYFVYLQLNVNWQLPCYLYRYDLEQEKLDEVAVWQEKRVTGIKIETDE